MSPQHKDALLNLERELGELNSNGHPVAHRDGPGHDDQGRHRNEITAKAERENTEQAPRQHLRAAGGGTAGGGGGADSAAAASGAAGGGGTAGGGGAGGGAGGGGTATCSRSASPPPLYDSAGRRTNTRQARYRQRLEDERDALTSVIPGYFSTPGYKGPRSRSVVLLGPRGSSLSSLSEHAGARVVIPERCSRAAVDAAKALVDGVVADAITVPEAANDCKRQHCATSPS
ncbi:hypothetical protein GGR56DRAFT_671190 [Xylariaceae sp. FL0804]|nr:hypothetical protein GGR56DRAFT_671190 [Xylariaceae sp. FL0804]